MEQTTQIMEITPEIAAEMLQHNKNNRFVYKETVNFYAEQMSDGKWNTNGESIKFDWNGNLIDGQHRLLAVIKSGVTILTYVIKNLDPESFATIDTGRGRSAGAVLSCKNIQNFNIVSTAIASYISLLKNEQSSDPLMNRTIKARKITNADVLEEYYNSPELYDRIAAFAKRIGRTDKVRSNILSLIKGKSIGGYMAYLIKVKLYPEEKVKAFFAGVNSKVESDNPAIEQLRSRLLTDALSPSTKLTGVAKSKMIIKSWNAYITGSKKRLAVKPDEQVNFI